MKRFVPSWSFVAVTAVAVLVVATFAVCAADSTATTPAVTSVYRVEGMTCGGCEASVKLTVQGLDGVRAVEASHPDKRATVTYDETKVTPQAIRETIEQLGYKAELLETKPEKAPSGSTGLLARLRACC